MSLGFIFNQVAATMKFRSSIVLLFAASFKNTIGFLQPSHTTRQIHHANHLTTPNSIAERTPLVLHSSSDDKEEKSSLDIMSMKVDIPDEVKDEIFRAEANTPAAKDRNQRIALYAGTAFIGILLSSMNVFLTTIRTDAGSVASDLSAINDLGFGWVGSNPLSSFFLLNKLGGGIALVAAGFGGTMVELEQRTKNENAEKIWKELQRRRSDSEGGKKKKRPAPSSGGKKKKKKKNNKRLSALSEVILEEETESVSETPETKEAVSSPSDDSPEEKKDGFMGKMKDFYEKADNMAASQALLLNKELEEKGIVDKITDETGLKVIGKEAASKLDDKEK